MPEEKIMTLHPQGKTGVNISKAKYDQVRAVVLEVIENQQPITFTYMFNPDFALELRYEGLNCKESGSFTGFSIAPLWLNQKTHAFY